MPSLWGPKALTRRASQPQQGRPWQSASKPQDGLADKRDKSVVRASWVSWQYSSHDITGASVAATQARRTQEGDTLRKEPQADWANSCPRSPATNVGSTKKHTKKELGSKTKKNKAIVTQTPRLTHEDHWTSCNPSCLAEPLTPSLVTTEQARVGTTKTTIFLCSDPKIKRMLVVWCSGLATATSSWVQSAKNISDGFSLQGCLDSKLDARILLRRSVMSSSKTRVWFQ